MVLNCKYKIDPLKIYQPDWSQNIKYGVVK